MNSSTESKKWWILFAMTGSLSMIMIDTTIFAVALRPIQEDLGIAQGLLEWVIIIYILVLASMMALGGHLGDLIGKPRAFVLGCIGFGVASLLCGFAWDGPSLIVFRLLQGMAAVIMQPASSALVIGSFAPGERGRAMAVYAGLPLLLLTVGPMIGGFITEQASWRYCFWINLPIALIVAGATLVIRPSDIPRPRKRFDWIGVVLLITGLPALILGIQQGNQWGWSSLPTLGLIVGGLTLLVLFVLVELKAEDPVIQLRLFKDRAFLGDALMLMLTQGAVTGVMIFMGLYLQIVMGFDPAKAGAALMPMMIPVLFMLYFAGRSYDKAGVRLPATVGSVIVTLGLGVLAWGTRSEDYMIIAAGMLLIGTGVPFAQVPSNTDGMSRVGSEKRGMASGVLQTFRQFGSATGLALIAAVIATSQSIEIDRMIDTSNDLSANDRTRLVTAINGDSEVLEEIRQDDPENALDLRMITRNGISNGAWTACLIASLMMIVAPITLSSKTSEES